MAVVVVPHVASHDVRVGAEAVALYEELEEEASRPPLCHIGGALVMIRGGLGDKRPL